MVAMTKTMVWFMLSDEQQTQFLEKFIRVDKLDMSAIFPVPNRVVNRTNWQRKHWGSEDPLVPISVDFTFIILETEQCPSSELFLALSKAMFDATLTVVSASNQLGIDVIGFTVEDAEIIPVDVQYPIKLACSVWGVDYMDYLEKRKRSDRNIVFAEDVKPCDHDDEGDDVLLFLEGVGEPICQNV